MSCIADDFHTMTTFIGTALASTTGSHPKARVSGLELRLGQCLNTGGVISKRNSLSLYRSASCNSVTTFGLKCRRKWWTKKCFRKRWKQWCAFQAKFR